MNGGRAMRRFDRISGIAFVTLAAAFFIGISPVSAKAEEVGISSDKVWHILAVPLPTWIMTLN